MFFPGENKVFPSSFLSSLEGRCIKLEDHQNHATLLNAYCILHIRVFRSMKRALDELAKVEGYRARHPFARDVSFRPEVLVDVYTDLVYRLAELFEFYEADVLAYFNNSASRSQRYSYVKNIKHCSREWKLLCNKCKHNHYLIIPVELGTEDEFLSGYSVFKHVNGVMYLDDEVHEHSEVFSYNASLRRMVCSILKADSLAAALVNVIRDEPGCAPLTANLWGMPYLPSIERIWNRRLECAPGEELMTATEDFFLDVNGDEFVNLNTPLRPLSGPITLSCVIQHIPPLMEIKLPGTPSVSRFTMQMLGGERNEPLSGFIEVIIRDIPFVSNV